ncbi:hypothetical protein SteCoe_34176 [Stentor coeruleus]|uniref:EF-hand domain-containing protein n=1 Tax=Stentor coeruleus TaxID=5963 RepID=A0A1R2AV30_9CILI|nr:hypothetical protein SteCoe_34176 [Stentor coeruleus]
MGNLLEKTDSNYLLYDILSPLDQLCNCNFYKGSKNDIIRVQKKIAKSIMKGFFIPITELQSLFRKTPLEDRQTIIESYFDYANRQQVNIMEVIAALITYSACTIEEKIHMALDVFDFDGNKVITKDEMVIMCTSFMRGIGITTQSALNHKKFSEVLAIEAFYLADTDPDGMITYDELYDWIKENEALSLLFTKYKPKRRGSMKRKSLIQAQGFLITDGPQDPILDKRFRIKVDSQPIKSHYRRPSIITQSDAINEIKLLFDNSANRKKRIIAKDIYEALSKRIEFHEFSSEFYNRFKSKLYSELTFEEIQASLFRRGSRRFKTLSVPPVEERMYPESSHKDLVLKKLFVKYDLNRDGLISYQEFRRALQEILTREAVDAIFLENDINGDGKLTFDDFLRVFEPYRRL